MKSGYKKASFEPSEDECFYRYRNITEIKIEDLLDAANIILQETKDSLIKCPALIIQKAMRWSLAHAYSVFDQLLIMGFLEPYEEDGNFIPHEWVENYRKGIIIKRKNEGLYKVLFENESQIKEIINRGR